jgi:integrase
MTNRRRTKYQGVQFNEDTGAYEYYGVRDGSINPKTGRPRQLRKGGFERATEARDARNMVVRDVRAGTHAPSKATTLAELVETDFATQQKLGTMRATTAEGYLVLFNRDVRPTLGNLRAQDLRAHHLNALYANLLDGGRRQAAGRRGEGLSPTTVHLVHSMLSGVFNRAVKSGAVAVNPCARAAPPSAQIPEAATWSLAELQAFLASDELAADPNAALYRIMAATGLRRGEALGLAHDDVDLDAGALHVRHNAVMVNGEVRIGEPKTRRSNRRVKIGPDSVRVLRDHLAAQREHRLTMGAGWHDRGLMFPRLDGRPQNPVHVSAAFRKLVAKTGLPPVTLHSLRHQHATLLLDQGEKIHDVAARLGHDASQLLRTYAHHGDDSQDGAAALESLLGESPRPSLRVVRDEVDEAQN